MRKHAGRQYSVVVRDLVCSYKGNIGFDDPLGKGQKLYALRVSTGIFNSGKQLEYFQKSLKEILGSVDN